MGIAGEWLLGGRHPSGDLDCSPEILGNLSVGLSTVATMVGPITEGQSVLISFLFLGFVKNCCNHVEWRECVRDQIRPVHCERIYMDGFRIWSPADIFGQLTS